MDSLTGKIAIVTGATSGLGWETVKAITSRGGKVVATGLKVRRRQGREAQEVAAGSMMEPSQVAKAIAFICKQPEGIRNLDRGFWHSPHMLPSLAHEDGAVMNGAPGDKTSCAVSCFAL